jgi:hypothetical protein
MRFFRTTWIPDETFFQTLVRHLVPESEIRTRPLTFLMFTDYGMPVTFYNDHYDLLLSQDYLFARKISPDCDGSEAVGWARFMPRPGAVPDLERGAQPVQVPDRRGAASAAGSRRGSGRARLASIGRGRTLMMVTCKKWHVAKRLVDRVRTCHNLPAIDYLFNEASTPLPDLGGIQSTWKSAPATAGRWCGCCSITGRPTG